MAVSSGIFTIPRSVQCDHFVTLDEPKNYMAQLSEHVPGAWENDPHARFWPFWADPKICKHVVSGRIRHMENIKFPIGQVIAAIDDFGKRNREAGCPVKIKPSEIKEKFYATLGDQYTQFGLQPGWGDCANVRGWDYARRANPVWFGDGHVAIPKLFNSMFMALQVATRLGYRTLRFIGVDLNEGYEDAKVFMRRWHRHAQKNGIEWINHSAQSALREHVMTDCMMSMEEVGLMLAEQEVAA